jgi:hypothetical protein
VSAPESQGRLIKSLAADLEPVRRIASLRVSLALILAVTAVLCGYELWASGPRDALASWLFADLGFGGVFFALLVVAPAASLAALASSVPGREVIQQRAIALAAAGVLVATVISAGLVVANGVDAGSPAAADAMCFRRVLGLAVLPLAVIVSLILRGWISASLPTALLGLLAAGALGACITHLTCPAFGGRHLLIGHVVPLFALSGLGVLPLMALLRRFAPR